MSGTSLTPNALLPEEEETWAPELGRRARVFIYLTGLSFGLLVTWPASPVPFLALFVPQQDGTPATHASLSLCTFVSACSAISGRGNSELSFKTGPGIAAGRKPPLTQISFSPCSRYTFYFHYSICHTLNYTCCSICLSSLPPSVALCFYIPVPGTKYTARNVR